MSAKVLTKIIPEKYPCLNIAAIRRRDQLRIAAQLTSPAVLYELLPIPECRRLNAQRPQVYVPLASVVDFVVDGVKQQ